MLTTNGTMISLTQGDSATLTIIPESTDHEFTANDLAVFGIRDPKTKEVIFRQNVVPDADGVAVIEMLDEVTATWEPKTYEWDIRYIIDATIDQAEELIDGDKKITPMEPGIFRVIRTIGGA